MDPQLQTALESVRRATVAASSTGGSDAVTAALRAALALQRHASTVDALIQTFGRLTIHREPTIPSSVDNARMLRGNLEETLVRTHEDALRIAEQVDPLIVALFTGGHTDEASDVKAARDALVASLSTLRSLADSMIDVMIVRESELDDDDGPSMTLEEALALDKRVA